MDRQLPPGLSDAQRCALLEFYAGHISAGQFSERLGIDASERAHGSSEPAPHLSRVAMVSPGGSVGNDLPEQRRLPRWPEFLRTSIRRSHGPAVGGTGA